MSMSLRWPGYKARFIRASLLALVMLPLEAAPAADARSQGEAALRAGRLEEATEHFERAVGESPDDAAAHYLLGEAYGRQANHGGMITRVRLVGRIREHYERAVALAPDEIQYREALLEYYTQAPAAFGGGLDKARTEAAEIAKRNRARGLVASGRIAQVSGDAESALSSYRQAVAERPEDWQIALRLIIQLQELKRWPEAFERADALLARDPSASAVWYQLGRTAVLSNTRHADGEAALRRFISMPRGLDDPPLAAAHWRLGILCEQQGRKQDARRQYERALQIDPEHAEARAALRKLD